MRPTNVAERQRTFLYFLIFFVVTIGLVLVTVCFGMQVLIRENEVIKTQLAKLQQNETVLYSFAAKMNDTEDLLDSINRPGVSQPELVERDISDRLAQLNSMIENDSTPQKAIYRRIIGGLASLKDAKKQLRDAGGNDAAIATLQRQVTDLEGKLQQANLLLTMQSQSR